MKGRSGDIERQGSFNENRRWALFRTWIPAYLGNYHIRFAIASHQKSLRATPTLLRIIEFQDLESHDLDLDH